MITISDDLFFIWLWLTEERHEDNEGLFKHEDLEFWWLSDFPKSSQKYFYISN